MKTGLLTAWLAVSTVSAQAPAFREEKLHGRHAWVLDNGVVRIAALRGGGHLAEFRFVSGDSRRRVNPMRVPHYPTIEPYEYDPARHDALYGDGSHRWLSSGYMGHLLCFPAFGPPSSEEEIRNQLGNHGEAPIVEWKLAGVDRRPDSVRLRYGAELSKTEYRVERAITLAAGAAAVEVEEWVENLLPFDRPINWVQHATFGPPFVEPARNYLDVSATRGEVGQGRPGANSLEPGAPVRWPEGRSRERRPVSLRPFQVGEHTGTYYALLLDPARALSYFTMYHDDHRVLVGYLFATSDHPWIGDWQENRSNLSKPWDGKVVARGIEFGTTPFAEGLRKSVERGSLYGVPTYRWIGGRQRLKTSFTMFLAEIGPSFPGVRDVRRQGSGIVVEPVSGAAMRVAAAGER